jgi:heptosyltransferase-2
LNQINQPKKIFILRNNDLGDVLVATPLVHGLKKAFPDSYISLGVGDWAKSLLFNNPNIDEIISCNAPWHNKQNCKFPANSPRTFLKGLLYVLFAKEAKYITQHEFTHGIDVLGSRQGSWLLRRSKIANRFGVRGYAGGENWCQQYIEFKEDRNVAKAGLAFLELMGANVDVEPRPIIQLSDTEIKSAENLWGQKQTKTKRIIIAPGGGFPEKCWGDSNYSKLAKLLLKNSSNLLGIIGSKQDVDRIPFTKTGQFMNLCGKLSLRESAALVSVADCVVTNSSLCMHLAGAFKVPSLTLLGDWYNSARLHKKQWGYPEGMVTGKEISTKQESITTPKEAWENLSNLLLRKSNLNC